MSAEKIRKSITNLQRAFAKLEEFVQEPIVNDRDRAGIIQGFEFCFELLWKTLQKLAEHEGIGVNSPKSAFAAALQLGIVEPNEETTCLELLKDRNLTSHTYKQELANEILGRVKSQYLSLFGRILSRIQAHKI